MFCFLLLQTTVSYNPFHKSHLTNKQVYFTRQQEVLVKGTATEMRSGRVWMPPSAISTSCAPHQKQHRAQRAPGFVLIHRKGWAQGLLISPSSCLPKRNWKRDRKYSISYKLGTHNAQQSIVQHHVEIAKIICFLPVSEAAVPFLKFSSFTLRLNSPNLEKSLRFTALYPSFISLNGEKQQLPGTVARKNWIQGLVQCAASLRVPVRHSLKSWLSF